MAEHAHAHHRNYVKIWGILLVLLVVSIVGPMLGIRWVMLVTAFGIALVKAYIVAKNFMHLDVEKPIIHWMMAIALTLMVLMFAGVAPDVMKDHGRRWVKDAGFHPVERVGHHGPGAHAPHSQTTGHPAAGGEQATGEHAPAPASSGTSSAEEGAVHDSSAGGH